MTEQELFAKIREKLLAYPGAAELMERQVTVRAKTLTAQEAIGTVDRKDYPILAGKEVMVEAEICGARGQAFTDAPSEFTGTLRQVLEADPFRDRRMAGLYIASLNAVMRLLAGTENVIHCRDAGPAACGRKMAEKLAAEHPGKKILLVGFQPSITKNLREKGFPLRVLDLNPENIGQVKFGITVEDGNRAREDAVAWAELILCTGSTVCNGTLVSYLDTGKETYFFGTTLSGTARLLGLPRLCFADEVG